MNRTFSPSPSVPNRLKTMSNLNFWWLLMAFSRIWISHKSWTWVWGYDWMSWFMFRVDFALVENYNFLNLLADIKGHLFKMWLLSNITLCILMLYQNSKATVHADLDPSWPKHVFNLIETRPSLILIYHIKFYEMKKVEILLRWNKIFLIFT